MSTNTNCYQHCPRVFRPQKEKKIFLDIDNYRTIFGRLIKLLDILSVIKQQKKKKKSHDVQSKEKQMVPRINKNV